MSVRAQLEALPLGERAWIGHVLIERFSLFGFRLWPALEVLDKAALASWLEDSGGAVSISAARDQTQADPGAASLVGTCAHPSPSAGVSLSPAEGAAEGVRWHAARAESVHIVVDDFVTVSKWPSARRAWLRAPGQAVCKPRGFRRLERVDAAPTCARCLREAKERGIALKGAT